jgi:hypothetical protein
MTGYESKRAAAQDNITDEQGRPMTYWGGKAQPAQEPDWKDRVMQQQEETILWQAKRITELIDAPPQRTWVELEGEEIRNLWEEATKPDRSTVTMVTSFARAIEAKLKEKNNGT